MTEEEKDAAMQYELTKFLMPVIMAITAGILILFWLYPMVIVPTIALLFPIGGFLHWLNCRHDDQEDK